MAPYNVDIKLKMDRFGMQPGPDARRFRTDLLVLWTLGLTAGRPSRGVRAR